MRIGGSGWSLLRLGSACRAINNGAYPYVGDIYLTTSDWEHARLLLLKSLQLYEQSHSDVGIARTTALLGGTIAFSGDVEKGKSLVISAISRAVAVGDTDVEARARTILGDILTSVGMLADAKRELKGALSLYTYIGDVSGQSTVLNSLAALYIRLEDTVGAQHLFATAYALQQSIQ